MAVVRNLESVRLWEPSQLLVTILVDNFLILSVLDIEGALEEHQWEDVGFEVSRINRNAKHTGGFRQGGFRVG